MTANDVMIKRFRVVGQRNKYLIAKDSNKRMYKIVFNKYSRHIEVGDDRYIYYTIIKRTLFGIIIEPISHIDYLKLIA